MPNQTIQRLRSSKITALALAVSLIAPIALTATSAPGSAKISHSYQTLYIPRAYTPNPPAGATDDYHCTMVSPKVTQDLMITGNQFHPGNREVHHAIMYLITPDAAKNAIALNRGGKGWSCFGETSIGSGMDALSASKWLTAWAPTKHKGLNSTPAGTGMLLPKGSVVVMQIHYNTLLGKKADRSRLVIQTTPLKHSGLKPLVIKQLPAPPDVPCAPGVTGPLCDRNAALANTQKRFGQDAVNFVNMLERVCGRDPASPPAANSTTCTWPVWQSGKLLTVAGHEHLTGRKFSLVLNPGTPGAKTLLNVKNFNFDDQGAIALKHAQTLKAGDKLQVNCTWDPKLRQQLPQLKKQIPRFVTWGAGSSDEMCLAILGVTAN